MSTSQGLDVGSGISDSKPKPTPKMKTAARSGTRGEDSTMEGGKREKKFYANEK